MLKEGWGPAPHPPVLHTASECPQGCSRREPQSPQNTIWKTLIRDALIVDKEQTPGVGGRGTSPLARQVLRADSTDSEVLLKRNKCSELLDKERFGSPLALSSLTYTVRDPIGGVQYIVHLDSLQRPSKRYLNLTICPAFQPPVTRSTHTQSTLYISW